MHRMPIFMQLSNIYNNHVSVFSHRLVLCGTNETREAISTLNKNQRYLACTLDLIKTTGNINVTIISPEKLVSLGSSYLVSSIPFLILTVKVISDIIYIKVERGATREELKNT